MSDKDKNNHQGKPEEQSNFPTISLPDSSAVIGGEIGRYKLLSVLGEGGFGIVYLAEQKRPVKRQVALKIIKPGMDTKQVIARFEAERQALALLEHPPCSHHPRNDHRRSLCAYPRPYPQHPIGRIVRVPCPYKAMVILKA